MHHTVIFLWNQEKSVMTQEVGFAFNKKKWQGRLLKLISYIFGSNDWQDQHHHQPWRSLVPWWSITADGFTPLMKRVIKHGWVWVLQRSADVSREVKVQYFLLVKLKLWVWDTWHCSVRSWGGKTSDQQSDRGVMLQFESTLHYFLYSEQHYFTQL